MLRGLVSCGLLGALVLGCAKFDVPPGDPQPVLRTCGTVDDHWEEHLQHRAGDPAPVCRPAPIVTRLSEAPQPTEAFLWAQSVVEKAKSGAHTKGSLTTAFAFDPVKRRVLQGLDDGRYFGLNGEGEPNGTYGGGRGDAMSSMALHVDGHHAHGHVSGRLWAYRRSGAKFGIHERWLRGHSNAVTHVLFDAAADRLVSVDVDGVLGIWSLEQQDRFILDRTLCDEVLQRLPDVTVTGLQWHDEERSVRVLLEGSDGFWQVDIVVPDWDQLGEPQRHVGAVFSAVMSPAGQLATGTSDGRVQLWDLDERRCVRTVSLSNSAVVALTFHPRDQRLFVAFADGSVGEYDLRWNEWGARRLTSHAGGVNALAASADGRFLAMAGRDGAIEIYHLRMKTRQRRLEGHTAAVKGLAFHPNGETLASCSDDGTVRVWDCYSGDVRLTIDAHAGPVHDVHFAHDGRELVSTSLDGTVARWKSPGGTLFSRHSVARSGVNRIAITADGGAIACALQDGGVAFIDPRDGRPGPPLDGHELTTIFVGFDGSQRTLISVSLDGRIRLHDFRSGKTRATFPDIFDETALGRWPGQPQRLGLRLADGSCWSLDPERPDRGIERVTPAAQDLEFFERNGVDPDLAYSTRDGRVRLLPGAKTGRLVRVHSDGSWWWREGSRVHRGGNETALQALSPHAAGPVTPR